MKIAVITIFAAISIVAAAAPAAEQPAAASKDSTALQFRRIYVPESVKDWPKGDVKYLPMDGREFERLVAQIQHKSPRLPTQSAAGIIQSQYECRLSGQSLLQGSGTLEVSPAIAGGMLMTLDPCNLAMDRAQWITSDGAPTVIGASSDGRIQVLAERAGQMRFDWSLAGQRDSTDAASFAIQLPPCPVNRLRIDLPADLLPSVDHGFISDEGAVEAGNRRWNVELGGRSEFRLRVAKKASDIQRQHPFLADQSMAYDISLRGLELVTDLNIAAHRGALGKVLLEVDPSLEVLEVSTSGQSLTWSQLPVKAENWRPVAVDLPVALQEAPAKLRFRAIAPLTDSKSWKLPGIQIEGANCRTNTMHVAVSSPLCVASLRPHECRQTAASLVKSPVGEQFDFDVRDSKSYVEVVLTRRSAEVQAVCATATLLGQGKMSSRVAADFRTVEGPVFSLNATVLPNWQIDTVRSEPADAVDYWLPDSRNGSLITIQLARPLTPARPLRLIVAARRLYTAGGRNVNVRLNMDDVMPLRFTAPVQSRQLVDLRTSGANELRLDAGRHLSRADVKELTAGELDLFAEPPGDMLLRDYGDAANVRLTLTSRKPTLLADIRLEAVVSRGVLEENYSFSCAPIKTAPIDRVLVHFSGHRENPFHWSIDGLDESRVSARRWSAAREAVAGFAADEEVWEVMLGSRHSMPFELRAVRRTTIAGPIPLCLASLPDAATQQASVLIRSLGPQAVQVKARRAVAMPIETAQAGHIQTARAAFRYDPREEATPHLDPAIVVACDESTTPSAWAWGCDIRSRIAADGAGDHQVIYEIENAGCRQVSFRLPPSLERGDLREILINKTPATAYVPDAASGDLAIDLPNDAKELELTLRISTSGDSLRSFRRLQPPLVDIGVPVLARRWSIELPPGYTTLNDGDEPGASDPAGTSIRRRLLGILGRGEEHAVFDPFNGGEWRSLFRPVRIAKQSSDRSAASDMAGWSAYRVNDVDAATCVTVIYRPATATASCLLFLALIAIGMWYQNGRPLVLTIVAITCGLCALLLPEAIAGVFTGGLLAVPACLLVALARKPVNAEASPPAEISRELASTLTNVVPYGAPVVAALMLSYAGWVRAEPPRGAPVTQSVFIPVNDKREPTGGKYLVPESFFTELYRRAALRVERPQGWLIATATYRAALGEEGATRAFAVDRLTAEFEIHVFDASARVRIPLRRDEVALVPDQAQLDDRPVQPEWEADGSALLLDIAEAGDYRLVLTLRPNVRPEVRGGFEVAIPRVPGARLEIAASPGGPTVAVPTAHGAVRWEVIPSRWIAELGPADRLVARWQDAPIDADEPVDVQQLQWLKIEQGCVLLDLRLKAKFLSEQSHRLQVKTDPSLELLPDPTAAAQPTVSLGTDGKQIIDCQMPASSSATLDLRFLCTAMPSVGMVRAPQIEVISSQPGQPWLAVSVDRSLGYPLHGGRAADPAAVKEFINNWGAGDLSPDFAFQLNGNAADWSMTTHVREPETSGDQTVAWCFDADEAQVWFDAHLDAVGGSVFQYALETPLSLHIDSLAVTSDGKEIPSRWIANGDGHLTVFIDGAATGRHRLQIRGKMSIPRNHKFDLPQFRLEDVHVQNSARLYRRPDVDVDVFAGAGLTEIKAPEDGSPSEFGQLLRSYYLDPATGGTVSVSIKPLRLPPRPEIADAQRAAQSPPSSVAAARVVAAKVCYVVHPDGRRMGAAVLEVDSPSTSDYPLIVPDGFQLLHLTVDGVPIDDVPNQGGSANRPVPLHAQKSQVEVLFNANPSMLRKMALNSGRISFPVPRLGDLPVESTTWTIATPRGVEAISAEAQGHSVAPDTTSADAGNLPADWRRLAPSSDNAVSYAVSGSPDSIAVGFRQADTSNWRSRLAAVIALVAVVISALALVRRGLLVAWLRRWPNVVGVVLGIAWWLWASPSALGLLIVAAILARQVVVRLRSSRALAPSAAA
jgi:hypothetical protein